MKFFDKLFNGKNLSTDGTASIRCSKCGCVNQINARFCASCGSLMQALPDQFDAFISYRRETASELASLIKVQLENLYHKQIFLDVKELQVGKFDEALLTRIEETPNFILILSKNSLDRCVDKSDWLKREIVHALATGRNIIPVHMENFRFPDKDVWAFLPDKMKDLVSLQAVMYNHINQDSAIRQIASYMKTELSPKTHSVKNIENGQHQNKPEKIYYHKSEQDSSDNEDLILSDYLKVKSNDLNSLKDKHIKEDKELKIKFDEKSSRYIQEKMLLLNEQISEIRTELFKVHFFLSDFKPQNQIDAFIICDFYFNISLYDYILTAQKPHFRSSIPCYDLLSNELSTFQETFIKKEIITWTIIKDEFPKFFNSRSVVTPKNISLLNNEQESSRTAIPEDYFMKHQQRVRATAAKDDLLFGDKTLINSTTTANTFIEKMHPVFLEYMNEKIALEKIAHRQSLTDGFNEPEIDKAKMEFYFLFGKFMLMYSYVLLMYKHRIEYISAFLEIEKKYLDCHTNWNKLHPVL